MCLNDLFEDPAFVMLLFVQTKGFHPRNLGSPCSKLLPPVFAGFVKTAGGGGGLPELVCARASTENSVGRCSLQWALRYSSKKRSQTETNLDKLRVSCFKCGSVSSRSHITKEP